LMGQRRSRAAGVLICLAAAGAGPAGCGEGEADSAPEAARPLHCYVGETMRPVMERLARDYERRAGVKVRIDAGGCGELLDRIASGRRGDVYVCHDPFAGRLRRGGLGVRAWTLAVLTPTIAVGKANPKKIVSVRDLARPGLKLAAAGPADAPLGWITSRVLGKAGLRDRIEANVVRRAAGCGAAADLVAAGHADAAIVWNAAAHARRAKLDAAAIEPALLPIAGIDAVTGPDGRSCDLGRIRVTMHVLACSKQPEAAGRFAEFVAGRRGLFAERFGFTPAPKDADVQRLSVHCDRSLRAVMQDAAEAFERKTAAKLTVNYAAGGTLIAVIKLKKEGDVYLPADAAQLRQLEEDGAVVSRRRVAWRVPVIVVARGKAKEVRGPADLVRPGIKLGVADPEACPIGRLTPQIFARSRVDPAAVRARTALSAATAGELAAKVRAGTIDAAIVWARVAADFAGGVEVVRIPPERNVASPLAVGVLKFSQNRPLAERFAAFLAGGEGKGIFARHGYTVEERKTVGPWDRETVGRGTGRRQ